VQDLENRLGEQSRLLNQRDFELEQLRNEMDLARKIEADLRAATKSATETLTAEIAQLRAELDRTIDERDRLARDLANLRRENEETWASERVEDALLRERINDVAAEVARLASALEGPNSPIDAILAAETVHDRVGVARTAEVRETQAGDLADRIRALQSYASRVHRDKLTSRN